MTELAVAAATGQALRAPALHLNRRLCRFETYQGGVVAGFIQYEMRAGQICFTLTQLGRDFRNYRFAAALIRAVLDEAYRRRLEVIPGCPLMRHFIGLHRQYLPLVPAEHRGHCEPTQSKHRVRRTPPPPVRRARSAV